MSERFNERRSRWWRWIAVGAVLVIVAAVAGAWWLIDPMSADNDADRISGIQAVFTIGFGLGGLATLALFARRQWLQELEHEHALQVASDARHDAEQRRITEQYIQAVEQLGHDKAPVRLGGLYGLDRLGRDHPGQREKIVEVWCAYLRRRYTPPADLFDKSGPKSPNDDAADEYEVRMTAQRLLTAHLKDLRPADERDGSRPAESSQYWHLEQLNLTGATLIDVDFAGCRLPAFNAENVRFRRDTSFDATHFESTTNFAGADFDSFARFKAAYFSDDADFIGARFGDVAEFNKARFNSVAGFHSARFDSDGRFHGTRFNDYVGFHQARFGGNAWFGGAHFDSGAGFIGTHFASGTGFNNVHFGGAAEFVRAHFELSAQFQEAHFGGIARFEQAHFHGRADFSGLGFGAEEESSDGPPAAMTRVVMSGATAQWEELKGKRHTWPPSWDARDYGNQRAELTRIETGERSAQYYCGACRCGLKRCR